MASAIAVAADPSPQRIVDQGIAVEMHAGEYARVGAPVTFRFDVTDTASMTPIGGIRPAAWLGLREPGSPAPDCKRQVAGYLGADLFHRAEVDLNSYYVLSLNQDASISVVDPLFGFGGSKLLTMLPLESPGVDWIYFAPQERLFVSLPAAGKVAVIDTRHWKLVQNIPSAANPRRLILGNATAWVANDHGVLAIDAKSLATQQIDIGQVGDLAIDDDAEHVFAGHPGAVSIIDAHAMRVQARVEIEAESIQLAYSSAAQALYASDSVTGRVFQIDPHKRTVTNTVAVRPGATMLRFAPDGRHALMPNPIENLVQVLDAATNRIVQSPKISDAPDQVTFTELLAYIKRRDSEIVVMISLDQLGNGNSQLGVADFPGGQHALGSAKASLANTIVEAPDGPSVLIANPADRMIYLYKEGMAAPAGGFSTYGQVPEAVMVIDHGLREQQRGRFATTVPVDKPGLYDVALFVDAPRVLACFELTLPAPQSTESDRPRTRITAIDPPAHLKAGTPARLKFSLTDATSKAARHADDLYALAFEAPGVWQQRGPLTRGEGDNYEFAFTPPEHGIYYVWIESAALGLSKNNPQFQVYQAD